MLNTVVVMAPFIFFADIFILIYYTKQKHLFWHELSFKSSNHLFNYNHNSDPEEKVQKLGTL